MTKKKRRYRPGGRIPGQRIVERRILELLRSADGLLGMYKVIAQQAANELARLKSYYVFGKLGGYKGELGCYEEGSDTICLHIQDSFRGKTYIELEKRTGNRNFKFARAWAQKADRAGIRHIHIGGHF